MGQGPTGQPDDSVTRPVRAEVPVSRRALLTVGAPAVATAILVGSIPLLLRARDAGGAGSSGLGLETRSTEPTSGGDVFTHAGSTNSRVLPGAETNSTTTTTSTTSTTTSSTTSTTTLPPTTTSERTGGGARPTDATATTRDLPAPIDPPDDPRGEEEFLRLGSISIPSLGVEEPLLEGIRLTTLDRGPGHWPGSAMPGEVGNVVVAAHRTSHGGPFRHIDQLVAGDRVDFTVDGDVEEYRVTGTRIVEPEAIWIVDPTPTPTATLFACHPPGSVAQRIVVHLELVD